MKTLFRLVALYMLITTIACESTLNNVVPETSEADSRYLVFRNVAELESADVSEVINSVKTLGYHREGDGGGTRYYRKPLGDAALPGDQLSDEGTARWRIADAEEVSVRVFGAYVDGESDDITAITDALRYSAETETSILQPSGAMVVSDEIVFPSGAQWKGAGRINTFVKKTVSHTGRMVVTEDFDEQTGITDSNLPGLVQDVRIEGITFDGAWMSADKSAYLNDNGGGGLFLFTARSCYLVDVRVQNMCGIGVFADASMSGLTGNPVGMGRSGIFDDLYIETTKEEGLIFRGAPDRVGHNVFQWNAGARITSENSDPTNPGPRSSPTYGETNGGHTDGVVLLRGMEKGFIHSFGNFSGLAIRVVDGRYNSCLFMAETSRYGGISVEGGYGDDNVFEGFRTGGGGIGADDDTPMVYINSRGTANLNYGNSYITAYHNNTADRSPRPCVVFGPQSVAFVGHVKTRGGNVPGHGIVIDGATNYLDITVDAHGHLGDSGEVDEQGNPIESSAIFRKANFASRTMTIRGRIRNCAVGFRSQGAPRQERVELDMWLQAGQQPFVGDEPVHTGQTWDIIADVGGTPSIIRY